MYKPSFTQYLFLIILDMCITWNGAFGANRVVKRLPYVNNKSY
jgi:hypothetical protein